MISESVAASSSVLVILSRIALRRSCINFSSGPGALFSSATGAVAMFCAGAALVFCVGSAAVFWTVGVAVSPWGGVGDSVPAVCMSVPAGFFFFVANAMIAAAAAIIRPMIAPMGIELPMTLIIRCVSGLSAPDFKTDFILNTNSPSGR